MMNKKGSLNLSIQMIVIVVIAFVVLGLGLGFVRSTFKDVTDTSSGIQEQIKQQVLDDLRRSNNKLSFPTSEITIGKNEATVVAIGIKNVNQGDLAYTVKITPLGGDAIFGGLDQTSIDDNFLYVTEPDTLSPTNTRVIPIRITSGTVAGTGQFKIQILNGDVLYDSKTFFITVLG